MSTHTSMYVNMHIYTYILNIYPHKGIPFSFKNVEILLFMTT